MRVDLKVETPRKPSTGLKHVVESEMIQQRE